MNQIICTVDLVLLTLKEGVLQVALLKRDKEPFKDVLALPGGFIHAEEDADARGAALRVLKEKAHITAPYLEQLATFSGPARDPRGWSLSIVYYALVSIDIVEQVGHSGRDQIRLVDVDKLMQLPFDHQAIIGMAVDRLRNKSQYSSLPCYLAGENFTLPQLQRVYEALMGGELNKVSFRRKMSEMGMLEEVDGRFGLAGAHRPAQLYRLRPEHREHLSLLERGL